MEYNSGNIRDPFLFLGAAASSGLDFIKKYRAPFEHRRLRKVRPQAVLRYA